MQAELTPTFVEIIAENIAAHGVPHELAAYVNVGVPVVGHGITLSPGSAAEPNPAAVTMLSDVARQLRSPLISEHICFVRASRNFDGPKTIGEPHSDVIEAGHLLPVPRTEEQLAVMACNVGDIAAALPVPLALEPIAALIEWPGTQMTEGEFVTRLLESTDTLLVLDLANVWANAINHGRDPLADALSFPLERIAYCHVAGGTWRDGMYQDSHAHGVLPEVLDLVRRVTAETGPLPLMLERDSGFPPRAQMWAELDAIADAAELPEITPPQRKAP